jgi:outer membrane protein OmpA-like peptidoglycan-associated protein
MRLSVGRAVLVGTLLSACAQTSTVPHARFDDLAAVLPEEGGKVGTVVVHHAGGETVLNAPYAAARIRTSGRVEQLTLDRNRVDRTFGPALSALPPPPASFTLYFFEGSDQLTAESQRDLTRVAAEIASRPAAEVAVIGHTDLVGGDQYNDTLSTQRAQRVREELARAGVPDQRIEVAARGKREPLYRTAEGVPEPRNRRVEISVR